ncbi:MAG: hypothetical protein E7167_00205 [Firmicutes bacterium]|nr:hypothetical protein [Bacillota bacterium]
MGIKRKIKKMSLYKKSLIVFTLLLLILAEAALIYVSSTLKDYENGDIDNYMNSLIKDMQKSAKRGDIEKYFELAEVKSDYEKKSSLEKGYKELFKEAKLSYKKTDDKTKYEIYADEMLLATVTLDDSNVEHRLGLLTYTNYEVENIENYNQDGLYELDFYIMDNYKLYINDIEVKEADLVESSKIEEYKEVYDLVNLPSLNHYKVDKLTFKPDIVIKDTEGKEIKYELKDGDYYATDFYNTDESDKALAKLAHEYDPLPFAKNWSLFLTADLPGVRYGLYTLTPNLIEGTQMYQRAYSWATNVDITFTSIHTLDKDTFTNTKVSNWTVYNENAFSVEVYLEKNMTLIDGQKKKDVLHDIFYYVYYDGAYRLVHMKSVTE